MDLILAPIDCRELGGAVRVIMKSNSTVMFEPMYDDCGTTRVIQIGENVSGLIRCRNDGVQYLDGFLEPYPTLAIPQFLAMALVDWDHRDLKDVILYHRPEKEIRQERGIVITVFYAAVNPGAFEERIRWHKQERLRVA